MNGDTPDQSNQPNPAPVPAPGGSEQKPVVIDRLRNASSILIAISANPSIDQLAASIGLTLLLEKFKKNATAVFSGKVPSALEFLHPDQHIQKTTDSLRDFIIAIDKSKADKLRYKVEDNVVKIFITPYKTSITEKDLHYNAGDFNVDLIVALGVKHQQDLDTAITSHGRIFHDAVVVSVNNTPGGDFGIANWEEFQASSLSELVASMAPDLAPDLLDADIATALLTGIVAETDRFSNNKTHPNTMNTSSILLAAGADQQLVNQQLQSVMSTDIKLDAGSEIKPTASPEEIAAADKAEEPEELIIDENGTFKSVGDDTSAPAAPAPAPVAEEKPADVPEKPADLPAPKPAEPGPAEPITVTESGPVQPPLPEEPAAPAPMAAAEPTAAAREAGSHNDLEATDDTEAARKAVDEALGNLSSSPIPAEQPAPGPAPEPAIVPEPMLMPPEAPAPAPAPTNVPPIGSEPAPLANSPADQAFTMPLPPSSSFGQAPPVVMPPTAPAPGAGMVPPPLPPPIMPPTPPAPPVQ